MESFFQVFAVVAALCAGIVILALFFTVLGYLKQRIRGFEITKVKGFIKDGRPLNVHLSSGRVFSGVRFIGFTEQSSVKRGIPYPFSQMVVCETAKGARVLFRSDAVRVIEELEDV